MSDLPIEISCETAINNVKGSVNQCSGIVEFGNGPYNITLWTAILFTALFGITTLLHLYQGISTRRWFMLCTVWICSVTELLGWAGRLWSSLSVEWKPEFGGYWYSNETAFLMQISTLIFAPAFLAAGWYIMLGKLIAVLGPQYCRFNRKTYAIAFVLGDVASIVIQAVGGGIASGAQTSDEADNGAKIMVIGVICQMAVMVLYTLLLLETVWRFLADRPVKPFRFRKTQVITPVARDTIPPRDVRRGKILIGAMLVSTILVFARSIYRTVELLDGWSGPIIANEALFVVLDATMIVLALGIFNVIVPGHYLPKNAVLEQHDTEKGVPMSHQSSRTVSDGPNGVGK